MNEALPIGILAKLLYELNNQVHLSLKVGNQNYDATVKDKRMHPSSIEYIEVTVAGDGEQDYLRMRALNEFGQASGLGKATKIQKQIIVVDEMLRQSDIVERECANISKAIERKLKKAYPMNTLLLLAFDDTMAFDRYDNQQHIKETIHSYMPRLQHFHSVALVGLPHETFIYHPYMP